MKRHWYRIYVGECPQCGRDASYRERVYGPKPKRHSARYVHLSLHAGYCGCLEG